MASDCPLTASFWRSDHRGSAAGARRARARARQLNRRLSLLVSVLKVKGHRRYLRPRPLRDPCHEDILGLYGSRLQAGPVPEAFGPGRPTSLSVFTGCFSAAPTSTKILHWSECLLGQVSQAGPPPDRYGSDLRLDYRRTDDETGGVFFFWSV